MKRINNKGFAISVMLYSILALISMIVMLILLTMAGSRKNNSNLIDNIKEDLNTASYNKLQTFEYTGGVQTFTVNKNGYYQIELWGASGAGSANSGKGAYTKGYIKLNAGDVLYFYVGQQGQENGTATFNGGGEGAVTNGVRKASGGGATDVRLKNGVWNDIPSLQSRIMVAAGGGSGDFYNSGSAGGTLIGGNGAIQNGGAIPGSGGTQILGGTNGGAFGRGGAGTNTYTNNCSLAYGGGGGYYGGGGGTSGTGTQTDGICTSQGYGGGGSSFISGYAGVNATTIAGAAITHTYDTRHSSEKFFLKGQMVAGEHSGDGKAAISYVGADLSKTSNQLNNVRYIKDCINGSNISTNNTWIELQAIQNGSNVAKGKSVTTTGTIINNTASKAVDGDINSTSRLSVTDIGIQCITVDLGESKNLDEIVVWHDYENNMSFNQHTLSVSNNNSSWVTLINQSDVAETPNGIRVSAY